MSEIENLISIRDRGIKRFIDEEIKRWVTSSGILCVHDRKYYKIGGRKKGLHFTR